MINNNLGLKSNFTRYFIFIATLTFVFASVFGVYFTYLQEGKIAAQRNEIVKNKFNSIKDNLLFLSIINDFPSVNSKIEAFRIEFPDFLFCFNVNNKSCKTENKIMVDSSKNIYIGFERVKTPLTQAITKSFSSGLFFSYVFLLGFSIITIQFLVNKFVLLPLAEINKAIATVNKADNGYAPDIAVNNSLLSTNEWMALYQTVIDLRELVKLRQLNLEDETRYKLARQVSHDIRSPLSALTMATVCLNELPEETRILIRNATQRINDIANDLLQKSSISDANNHEQKKLAVCQGVDESELHQETTTQLLSALIDILVSEKRMQYREHIGLEIEVDLKDSFGTFAQINGVEFKRAISNLINNSIEALPCQQGKVIVGVRKCSSEKIPEVQIFIKDNGKGIPKHVLKNLGKAGVSVGKSSGNGLGIYHAKKTIESLGGTLAINSTHGEGTLINIGLPLADTPKWFAKEVNFANKKYIVTLDDDISIHQIWARRIRTLGIINIEHVRFQSGEAFEKYIYANISKLNKTLFLIDFELLKQIKTGLDIIEELCLEKYSILVTSRYEEVCIQDRAFKIGLTILPKALAGFVPIVTDGSENSLCKRSDLIPENCILDF